MPFMICLLMQESLPQAEELCIDITALQSWVRHMILTCKPGTKKKKVHNWLGFFSPSLFFQVFQFAFKLQHGKESVSHLQNPDRHLAAVKIPGAGGGREQSNWLGGSRLQNPFRQMITK